MTKKIREWIEDILKHRLIWDPKTNKFKKVIVYKEDEDSCDN